MCLAWTDDEFVAECGGCAGADVPLLYVRSALLPPARVDEKDHRSFARDGLRAGGTLPALLPDRCLSPPLFSTFSPLSPPLFF